MEWQTLRDENLWKVIELGGPRRHVTVCVRTTNDCSVAPQIAMPLRLVRITIISVTVVLSGCCKRPEWQYFPATGDRAMTRVHLESGRVEYYLGGKDGWVPAGTVP